MRVPTFWFLIAGGVALAQDPSSMRISLVGKPWSLAIDSPGFKTQLNETKPDGRRYLEAVNEATGMVLSATLEQVSGPADLEGCRQGFRGRLESLAWMHPSGETERRDGQIAIQEFMVKELNGAPIQQQNLFACFVKENVFVDVHISKTMFTAKDQPLFAAILGTIHFVDGNAGGLSSLDYFREGSKPYVVNDFAAAIGPYQKALDMEKQDRKLDLSTWRVLLDNLAMAYGVTGKDASAEEVVRYGLTKDPQYPMFYFILADVYAERGDLDNTIKFLTTAFENRNNVIPGEKLPDPRTDDSFQRFLKNERFMKFLDSLPK